MSAKQVHPVSISAGFAATLAATALVSCAPLPAPVAINEAALATPQQWAASCRGYDREDWDTPAPPYRIFANTYQVGTCGLTSVLVVGDEGAVLIDPLTEGGAKVVLANVERLGLQADDVRYLVLSHEHFDHAGGAAYVVGKSGAHLLTGSEAAKVMSSGTVDPADPQADWLPAMPPVKVSRILGEEETLSLGSIEMHGFSTPGHTAGAYSWSWNACDQGDCRRIVFADSLSPANGDSWRWSDHPAAAALLRKGLARLAAEPCHILITGHPGGSGMVTNAKAGIAGGNITCAQYAATQSKMLSDKIAAEQMTK